MRTRQKFAQNNLIEELTSVIVKQQRKLIKLGRMLQMRIRYLDYLDYAIIMRECLHCYCFAHITIVAIDKDMHESN